MITFISGLMKGGKSKKIIEQFYADNARNKLAIKPSMDSRDGATIKSRASQTVVQALAVNEADIQMVNLLLNGAKYYQTIYIDEVQFFSAKFIKALESECFSHGVDLVCSGLLKDFKGDYFPSSEWLHDNAHDVYFYKGECDVCGKKAELDIKLRDGRLVREGDSVQVEGQGEEIYATVCRKCYNDCLKRG